MTGVVLYLSTQRAICKTSCNLNVVPKILEFTRFSRVKLNDFGIGIPRLTASLSGQAYDAVC